MEAKFPGQVDTSGTTAIRVNSSTAHIEADVVPCFNYRYYFNSGSTRDGARTFKKAGGSFENYPVQHLANGRKKNTDTNSSFKRAVRILKRVENIMVVGDVHREVPSYFVECLVYNCRNSILNRSTWVNTVKGILGHIWNELEGDGPDESRWMEVNDIKYLFHSSQKWTRRDGRDFTYRGMEYLGFAS